MSENSLDVCPHHAQPTTGIRPHVHGSVAEITDGDNERRLESHELHVAAAEVVLAAEAQMRLETETLGGPIPETGPEFELGQPSHATEPHGFDVRTRVGMRRDACVTATACPVVVLEGSHALASTLRRIEGAAAAAGAGGTGSSARALAGAMKAHAASTAVAGMIRSM